MSNTNGFRCGFAAAAALFLLMPHKPHVPLGPRATRAAFTARGARAAISPLPWRGPDWLQVSLH